MDIWMDVDVNLAEVPVNLLPLLDDTNFKAIEADVNYNAAGLSLIWNFVTTAGAYSQTAVTPANSSPATDYSWIEQGNGVFTIQIPASGGASINNNTEGFGWFTGVATGILPWRGPVIGFRAAGLNNALIDDVYSATQGLAGTTLADWVNGGRLDLILDAILAKFPGLSVSGVVAADSPDTNSATTFLTDLISGTAGYYNRALMLITSGALVGQVSKINATSGDDGAGTFTVDAGFTGIPAVGVTFRIINQ